MRFVVVFIVLLILLISLTLSVSHLLCLAQVQLPRSLCRGICHTAVTDVYPFAVFSLYIRSCCQLT